MPDPMILMCAPNGARRTQEDHPKLPITPEELADCAEGILAAGASIIHLHVRDDDAQHTLSVEKYRAAISAIRARVGTGLIIQITTEAVGIYSREKQIAAVTELRPEAASIALREICPSEEDVPSTAEFFTWMRKETVFPQIILYDQQDVARFQDLQKRGVFATETPFVLCVVGRYGLEGQDPVQVLSDYSSTLAAANIPWAVCGFGQIEHQLALKAAELGGHMRVGFENNLWRQDGKLAANNGELVHAAKEAAEEFGRVSATADDVRTMFGYSG